MLVSVNSHYHAKIVIISKRTQTSEKRGGENNFINFIIAGKLPIRVVRRAFSLE